jgi:signal transduction histidine kinase
MSAQVASFLLAGWLATWWRVARQRRERIVRACHELRGPLTAAGLALESMARRGEAPPPRISALETQLRRARVALDDLSGAASEPLREPVNMAAFLAELRAVWEPVVRAHGRTLVLADEPHGRSPLGWIGAPDVRADATRLHQAAGNLVANALEHGEGEIELRLGRDLRRVRLEVRDAGGGPAEPVASLIRRPRAGRGPRGRGLAIASEIARQHEGRLVGGDEGAVVLELPVIGAQRRERSRGTGLLAALARRTAGPNPRGARLLAALTRRSGPIHRPDLRAHAGRWS